MIAIRELIKKRRFLVLIIIALLFAIWAIRAFISYQQRSKATQEDPYFRVYGVLGEGRAREIHIIPRKMILRADADVIRLKIGPEDAVESLQYKSGWSTRKHLFKRNIFVYINWDKLGLASPLVLVFNSDSTEGFYLEYALYKVGALVASGRLENISFVSPEALTPSPTPSLRPTWTPKPDTPTPTPTPTLTGSPIPTPTPTNTPTPQPTWTPKPDTPTPTPPSGVENCPTKDNGDADCNGEVGLADFSIWLGEYRGGCRVVQEEVRGDCKGNADGRGSLMDADFNNDGRVTLEDFYIWYQSYYF